MKIKCFINPLLMGVEKNIFNRKKNIDKFRAFTLVEILVAIGVLGVLMVTTVGVMTMSFKAKNVTDANELLSSRAQFVLQEIQNNVLNAEKDTIICPSINGAVGSSIGFDTKNGGTTVLNCDNITGQIASSSANGDFNLLDSSVRAVNCDYFLRCNLSGGSEVVSIGVSLNLALGATGSVGTTGLYWQTVTPRD